MLHKYNCINIISKSMNTTTIPFFNKIEILTLKLYNNDLLHIVTNIMQFLKSGLFPESVILFPKVWFNNY